jgi:hypothetical protein
MSTTLWKLLAGIEQAVQAHVDIAKVYCRRMIARLQPACSGNA